MSEISLIQGDCLERMKEIPDGSVDMVLTDPPYGTTACKWDSVIPFEPMWEQLHRITKVNGAIALFGSEPFSSALRMSNIKNYKYDWIWRKEAGSNFATVKYMPWKEHEHILVFEKKGKKTKYFPIMQERKGSRKGKVTKSFDSGRSNSVYGEMESKGEFIVPELRYPSSVLEFNRERGLHPTQKPVALMEYLIRTYTNEGETVLDFTMGSGTTGVACVNTNRNFIGIELDEKYFNIAQNRIEEAKKNIKFSLKN